MTRLDRRMRVYETAHDHRVLPGLHMVARIDGRTFSTLTRGLDAPYDARFKDCMVTTLRHLVTGTGFSVLYGYTQSDELSILLRRDDELFGRSLRKLLSVLAGEASAAFSLAFGAHGAFDARVSQLPDVEAVVDYFLWRQEDAHRNALNAHSYWLQRERGMSEREATEALKGATAADRNELLFEAGINFNEVPAWQRRGIGMTWERDDEGRRAVLLEELPMKAEYAAMIRAIVERQ